MASSSSARPHSTPMPVGPIILWAEKARKSTPSAATSTGACGTELGAVGHHHGAGAVGRRRPPAPPG